MIKKDDIVARLKEIDASPKLRKEYGGIVRIDIPDNDWDCIEITTKQCTFACDVYDTDGEEPSCCFHTFLKDTVWTSEFDDCVGDDISYMYEVDGESTEGETVEEFIAEMLPFGANDEVVSRIKGIIKFHDYFKKIEPESDLEYVKKILNAYCP